MRLDTCRGGRHVLIGVAGGAGCAFHRGRGWSHDVPVCGEIEMNIFKKLIFFGKNSVKMM